ncbi:MAG: hypothetical protein GXP10_01215 [Gammaproteobacteria bacterium]|nr:hypothetical protein [Gammaproteobacteria bacterium]
MATLPITPIYCRTCGAIADLWQAIEDAEGRLWVKELTDLPALCIRPMRDYLKLHKPPKKALSYKKLLTLTRELSPMIRAAEVRRNRTVYAAPAQSWAAAMTRLVEEPPKSLTLPLNGHGYLLSIVAGESETIAAKAEHEAEQRRQHRAQTHGANRSGLTAVSQVADRAKASQELKKAKAAARGKKNPPPGAIDRLKKSTKGDK